MTLAGLERAGPRPPRRSRGGSRPKRRAKSTRCAGPCAASSEMLGGTFEERAARPVGHGGENPDWARDLLPSLPKKLRERRACPRRPRLLQSLVRVQLLQADQKASGHGRRGHAVGAHLRYFSGAGQRARFARMVARRDIGDAPVRLGSGRREAVPRRRQALVRGDGRAGLRMFSVYRGTGSQYRALFAPVLPPGGRTGGSGADPASAAAARAGAERQSAASAARGPRRRRIKRAPPAVS